MSLVIAERLPVVDADLRGGKLPRDDQERRDMLIADYYQRGASQAQIEAAFLVSRGTVWAAIKRHDAQISPSQWKRRADYRKKFDSAAVAK